ncbi:MAG TPA: hypothetical protein VNQ73_00025, partial [Ilumatobacter sp.]|nr:hypothetical protein [Ilumatobacter sp.]
MRTKLIVGMGLIASASTVLVLGSGSSVAGLGWIGPGERRCFTVAGSPGDAALVNLTPVEAAGAGNGKLVGSDISNPPAASNVNFSPNSVDPNVAVVSIGIDNQVCYVNSHHTSIHLVADHLGTVAANAYQRATSSGAPKRTLDTRTAGRIGPGERRCFTVAGHPGDAALVNLTPVEAAGAGNGKLVGSDISNPPAASNVNFSPDSVDPNVAVAPIGVDNQVCYVNSHHTSIHLVADHLGTIATNTFQRASTTGAPRRTLDTRAASRVGPGERRCFTVAGNAGDAALVNLTPVEAAGAGNGKLVSSDVSSPPAASNVNFSPNSVDPNVAVAPIGVDNQVCYVNSHHTSIHLVADHLGTVSANAYQR